MKIKVWCDSGANIMSSRKEIIDTEKDWDISDEIWREMSDDDRYELVQEWALQRLDIGYDYEN